MIPYAALMLSLVLKDGNSSKTGRPEKRSLEVQVMDIVEEGVSLRVASAAPVEKTERVDCLFLDHARWDYNRVILEQGEFSIKPLRSDGDVELYILRSEKKEYLEALNRLLKDYLHYIQLKTEHDELTAMELMTGRPLADAYPGSLEEWQQKQRVIEQRNAELRNAELRNEDRASGNAKPSLKLDKVEIAVCLDCPSMWDAFLSKKFQDFLSFYWQENGLTGHAVTREKVTHIYIGNSYCPLLFPGDEKLEQILAKAGAEGLTPVIVLSTLPEYLAERAQSRVKKWLTALPVQGTVRDAEWKTEIVVNDLGWIWMIKETLDEIKETADNKKDAADGIKDTADDYTHRPLLTFRLGPLLCKRKKDVRMNWQVNYEKAREANGRTSVNGTGLLYYLKETYGIRDISCEVTGYPLEIPPGEQVSTALHLPMFQMNTSGYCTLKALCETGDRGNQEQAETCRMHCEKYMVAYPENVPMIGRWNSLFGCTMTELNDPGMLNALIRKGVTRLVVRM